RNPRYESTFVFTNDYPALVPADDGEYGTCRVVCYSPRHDLSFGDLPRDAVERVLDVWTSQYAELGADPRIGHVQIFENRGAAMGASSPHPHGQIWATEHVPMHVQREQERLAEAPTLIADYLAAEDERVVEANDHVVAVVPYWAVWPFETLVAPRRQVPSLLALTGEERIALASILAQLVRRYDRLFSTPFPYSMGIHQAPTDGQRPDRRGRSRPAPIGMSARVARAPGRVNLLGEHTDYNDGFVLPVAIDRFTRVDARRRSDRVMTVTATDLGERDEFTLDANDRTDTWRDYVRGVVALLRPPHGFDLVIASSLPRGAGLSSSAALEVAVGRAVSDLPAAELAL